MASLDDVPDEILVLIVRFIPRSLLLLTVSRRWARVIRELHTITIPSSTAVYNKGLNGILKDFPMLKYLRLRPCQSIVSTGFHPLNVHMVALQFEGHPMLNEIDCVSEGVVSGAIKCPRLTKLSLPHKQSGWSLEGCEALLPDPQSFAEMEKLYGSGWRRHLGFLLEKIPQLKSLILDSPMFWSPLDVLEHTNSFKYSKLESLVLTEVTQSTASGIIAIFDAGAILQNVTHLTMDLCDNQFCPERRAIKSISNGLPSLRELRLKFGVLGASTLDDICAYLPRLTLLKFTRCSLPVATLDYLQLLGFIGSHLLDLETFYLKHCTLSVPENYTFQSMESRVNENLKSLKIFDKMLPQFDGRDIQAIMALYPNLVSLRTELSSLCLPASDPDPISIKMNSLDTLELRFDKTQRLEKTAMEDIPLVCPNLTSFSVSGFPAFPSGFISSHQMLLTSLTLNFITTPPPDIIYSLPHLQLLQLKAVGDDAQLVCMNSIRSLTRYSRSLAYVSVDAMNQTSKPFSRDLLSKLIETAPRMKSFQTFGFKFHGDTALELLNGWSELSTIALKGHGSLDVVSDELERKFLFPFLKGHVCLKYVILGVSGMHTDLELCGDAVDVTRYEGSDHDRMKHKKRLASYQTFRKYEERLCLLFPFLSNVIVRGPIEKGYHRTFELQSFE